MSENYQIDKLDRQILNILAGDAKTPFIEIARKLIVSGGTIHQRVDRLKKLGIITGSQFTIDYQKLGYDVTVFLSIHLKSSKDSKDVIDQMKKMPQIVEVYYTTGNFAFLVKVRTKSIQDFHNFLAYDLQGIDSIQSTESFISLSQPIARDVTLSEKSFDEEWVKFF